MNICSYDCFKKEADRQIAEQDKFRPESPTENDGLRKGRVKGVDRQRTNQTHKLGQR